MKPKVYLLLLMFLIIPFSIAVEEPLTVYEVKFLEVEDIMFEMQEDGFNIVRMNDTLKAARQIYEGQMNIKTESLRDFTLIDSYMEEIDSLKAQGYITKDEITYVYGIYDDIKLENPQIDLTDAETIIEEMQFGFDSERYDEAYDLAKEAYSKLVEIEGQYTALNLAYKTTTQTLKSFFVNNWMTILIVLVVALILYLIIKNRLRIILIRFKLKKLARESQVLEELIKTTQKDYFENDKMSESTYRIRIKKFSDLMRDINRQIPLLKEELAKRRKKSGGKFNPDELVTTTGRKVEKVRHGEIRVHKNKPKDKGIKAPIKERKVQFKMKGDKKSSKKITKKKEVKKKTVKKKPVKKKKR